MSRTARALLAIPVLGVCLCLAACVPALAAETASAPAPAPAAAASTAAETAAAPPPSHAVVAAGLRNTLAAQLAAKDYGKALVTAKELRDTLEMDWVDVLYRIAAIQAQLGDKEATYEALGKLFEAGFGEFPALRADTDFELVRHEERFIKMMRKAWAGQYLAMLERPGRESFQKPDEVMKALAFKPGERVADIGAGSGYFTLRVARVVAPAEVLAIDIRQEMLDYIAARLEAEKVSNVKLSLVTPDDPKLPAGAIDTVLLVDTIHYVKDLAAYAKTLRPGLSPKGRIVIIDYRPKSWEERPWGPPPEQQVSREKIDEAMGAAGLAPVRVHEFLPEQYFIEYAVR